MSKNNRGSYQPGKTIPLPGTEHLRMGDGPAPTITITDPIEIKILDCPFLAEDMTFRPDHHTTVTNRLNDYLNDFRKAYPNAALLQMIPTGPGSFTFVWEL